MFPNKHYSTSAEYFDEYKSQLLSAYSSVMPEALNSAAALLMDALSKDACIFACGNGGSAAISNHMGCDHQKGIATGTKYRPKMVSLSSNIELITAIGNDIGYEDIFSHQLMLGARSGDVLFAISSSGNSQNIINAINYANKLGMKTIALTGFDGGHVRNISMVSLHVSSSNYGVIEDVHQSCMHSLGQFIRHSGMNISQLIENRF
jgi:phosphoheptose isomerase